MMKQDIPKKPLSGKLRQRRRQCLRNLFLLLAFMLATNAGISALMITWRAPVVVAFDMKGTIDRFMEQVAAQQHGEDITPALTGRFMEELDAALRDYQKQHDALVLVSPAVVVGATDITADIQAEVAIRMAQKAPGSPQ
ncbi:type-F conjugative transfer system protein TrbI [Serratia fonticola]|uniref:Conjugal transfer protein TrbI n=2 Tax=Enterobacterales TaxID=91347 RepID=A0A0N9MZ46_PECCA|nr:MULTISPECIES: type-F conjugative transfer system protein TrbI [Enterobacterales]ALG88586.1 conjugal transfer protein TrbI [Pectobacterium carotovorum]MDQ9128473.1 type-F conjugative transfer system protein TrbI [Serratia fonticola]